MSAELLEESGDRDPLGCRQETGQKSWSWGLVGPEESSPQLVFGGAAQLELGVRSLRESGFTTLEQVCLETRVAGRKRFWGEMSEWAPCQHLEEAGVFEEGDPRERLPSGVAEHEPLR